MNYAENKPQPHNWDSYNSNIRYGFTETGDMLSQRSTEKIHDTPYSKQPVYLMGIIISCHELLSP